MEEAAAEAADAGDDDGAGAGDAGGGPKKKKKKKRRKRSGGGGGGGAEETALADVMFPQNGLEGGVLGAVLDHHRMVGGLLLVQKRRVRRPCAESPYHATSRYTAPWRLLRARYKTSPPPRLSPWTPHPPSPLPALCARTRVGTRAVYG